LINDINIETDDYSSLVISLKGLDSTLSIIKDRTSEANVVELSVKSKLVKLTLALEAFTIKCIQIVDIDSKGDKIDKLTNRDPLYIRRSRVPE
jgi:hypothetical protein